MRAVNLLPREAERPVAKGVRAPLLVAVGGVAAVTATVVVLGLSASGAADERRAELDAVEAAIAAASRGDEGPAPTPAVVVQERTDRIAALSAALSARISFDRVLRELGYLLPDDVWLTGLIASGPTVTAPAGAAGPSTSPQASSAAQGVTIQGATYSHASVARLLARLAAAPSLGDVRLTATAWVEPQAEGAKGGTAKAKKAKKAKQRTLVTFTVDASVQPEGRP